ncbi:MAG: 30S ribosomal protein S27ae [Nanoarchaeota archaeon]|nr:30S ribosomal protein S27ae [Nanoarchaeota archaeon]
MAEKKIRRREKKKRTGKKHSSAAANKYYTMKGKTVERVHKSCPRCGPGTWLGVHKTRVVCGRCGYSETEKATHQATTDSAPASASQ